MVLAFCRCGLAVPFLFYILVGRLKIAVKRTLLYLSFNICPNCLRGKVFKGLISLNKHCKACNISFEEKQIGDAASWISTFLLCILSIPLALILNLHLNISILSLFLLMTVVILILTTILLRITRYLLIKKIIKLEYETNKQT